MNEITHLKNKIRDFRHNCSNWVLNTCMVISKEDSMNLNSNKISSNNSKKFKEYGKERKVEEKVQIDIYVRKYAFDPNMTY